MASLDSENVNALWDRAALAKELGEHRMVRRFSFSPPELLLIRPQARNSLLTILKRVPYDLTVLEELRLVLIELGDFKLCAELFHRAFEHYVGAFPRGHGVDPATGAEIPGGGFGLMELLVLADLHTSLGRFEHAVHVIRHGCRWLQGRGNQRFWDACKDDRKYDKGE